MVHYQTPPLPEAAERARAGNAKGGSAERKSSNESLLDSIAPKQDSDARALTQAAKAVGAGREATERMAAVLRARGPHRPH
jgi:hypothetical protein